MSRQHKGMAVIFIACLLLSSCSSSDSGESSEYLPSIRDGDSYRFSTAQLERMVKTPLKRDLFLRYMEAKWPLTKIMSFCTPENRWPELMQNLVKHNDQFGDVPLYEGQQHDFDKIFVYVCEDDGKSNYFGLAGTKWKRWEYSLNIVRNKDHWAIIEHLPNDFTDNPNKYLSQQGQ